MFFWRKNRKSSDFFPEFHVYLRQFLRFMLNKKKFLANKTDKIQLALVTKKIDLMAQCWQIFKEIQKKIIRGDWIQINRHCYRCCRSCGCRPCEFIIMDLIPLALILVDADIVVVAIVDVAIVVVVTVVVVIVVADIVLGLISL